MSQRAQRVPADEARRRILAATRELLLDRPFAALTVGDVMARAGLTRTVFYRHFEGLPQLAPDLLPDAEDPLVDRVLRGSEEDLIDTMITGLVGLYADNGRWLRALDGAAAADRDVAAALDRALVGPRRLLETLVADAPSPPPSPREFALLLMAAHRAYLLDKFGGGDDTPENRQDAIDALAALWRRLLAN